ncbi:MAG: hypothetical protein IT462_05590 [Planctomycetes bacterium]|nr:hypothetical protein [Planctomycetota bacterium]
MRFRQGVGLTVLGLGLWVLLSGCGPGLILLGGGGTGGWLGLSGSNKDDDKGSPAPVVNPGPTNTAPVAVVQSLDRRESPAPIAFRLIDAESDLIDVVIEFSLVVDPLDTDFQACTGGLGSSLSGLTSSAGGVNHTWDWDYGQDLGGLAAQSGITIRVRPNDGTVDGSTGEMGDFVVGNSPPIVMTAQAVGATLSGNVLITYDLGDSTSDDAGFEVNIISSEAGTIGLEGDDFLGTNPIGLPGTLITSPGGTTGQIVWDSERVFPFHEGTVQILITPKDQPTGFTQVGQGNAITIGPYTLNNLGNRTPSLQIATPPDGKTFYGDVDFRVLVQDLDASSVYIHCEYQLVIGGPYADCNMGTAIGTVGPFATLPNQPLAYDLQWEAMLDLQSLGIIRHDTCRLRLTVSDTEPGQVLDTGQFGVLLGERPVITSASVQGDDGEIPLIINISDSAEDPCTLQVGYRLDTNSMTPFQPLTQADFTFGDLGVAASNDNPEGQANVYILDTLSTLLATVFGTGMPNQPTVQLQIIATDHPPDDNTGDALNLELDSLPFIVGPFPVLNNPTDQSVQSLTIAVTAGGDQYTILPNGTREFTATVFPPQAGQDNECYWSVYPSWICTFDTIPSGQPTSTQFTLTLNNDPEGFTYLQIYAQSFQQSGVFNTYYIFIGDPVNDIDAQPDTLVTLFEGYWGQTGSTYQFTAVIDPPTAPQYMFWSVPTGMGTIYSDGYYQAPDDITSTLDFNAVVATVDPLVFDIVPVRVVPRPTSVSINGQGSVAVGSASVNYTASVSPAAAPQAVFWEITWNGFNYGAGNDFFGRIDANGVYTPPISLPQPDTIGILARSQFDYYVYTEQTVQLTGNPPTNFMIVMDPATPGFVYANGQGKDFNATTFTPPDAPYVTWTVDQPLGFIDSVTGYYTPPEDIGPTSTNVTIRARATYGGVEKTFSLQIQPRLNNPPTSIIIKPAAGLIPDDSNTYVDFLSLANPPEAEQDVNWTIQTGLPNPAFSGSVDPGGRYFPPNNYDGYNRDGTVVVRAQSTVVPVVTQVANVNVSGYGNWQAADRPALGRNDPVGIWDPTTQRCWFIGGRSETVRGTEQDLRPWVYDGSAAPAARWVPAPDMNDCLTSFPAKNALAVCRTPSLSGVSAPYLVGVVGNSTGTVSMAALDLTTANSWFQIFADYDSAQGAVFDDIPVLSEVSRYHMFDHFDATFNTDVLYLVSGTTIYRFGCTNTKWLPRLQAVTGQPTAPNSCAYFRQGIDDYLVGPSVTNNSETACIKLQLTPSVAWVTVSETSGAFSGPRTPALSDTAAVVTQAGNKVYMFGGKRGANTVDELWEMSLPAGTWTLRAGVTIKPSQRYDAAFSLVQENGVFKLVLFGGRIGNFGSGLAGDLWEYSEVSNTFLPFNPLGIFPQARKYAAAAWANNVSAGYMFGGTCQYGNSNETWRFTYNPTNPVQFVWTRFAYSTLSQPPGLRGASMVYDTDNARILMLWGSFYATTGAGTDSAVYVLNTASNTWSMMNSISGTTPQSRLGAAVCYDPDNDRVVTFGGMRQSAGANVLLNDISYLKVVPSGTPQWQVPGAPMGPSIPPLPAYGAFIGYDPTPYNGAQSRYLVFGGNRNPNGENANSEMFTFTPATNQWGSIILQRPWYARPAFDCAGVFDGSAFRRFLYAPKGYSNATGAIMGNTPEWHNLSYGPFAFNVRSGMGVYDPTNKRFFALMGEVDVPGVGAAQVATFRVMSFSG